MCHFLSFIEFLKLKARRRSQSMIVLHIRNKTSIDDDLILDSDSSKRNLMLPIMEVELRRSGLFYLDDRAKFTTHIFPYAASTLD